MGIGEKIRFKWDPLGMVGGLIKKWKPRDCKTEKDYEKSLYSFLHKELGDIQVTKQFARGRVRADLAVGDKVIIELKNSLDTTAKYQRLMGQLREYQDWDGFIVVVLTGKTDPNLRKELDNYVEKEGATLWEETITIIDKRV